MAAHVRGDGRARARARGGGPAAPAAARRSPAGRRCSPRRWSRSPSTRSRSANERRSSGRGRAAAGAVARRQQRRRAERDAKERRGRAQPRCVGREGAAGASRRPSNPRQRRTRPPRSAQTSSAAAQQSGAASANVARDPSSAERQRAEHQAALARGARTQRELTSGGAEARSASWSPPPRAKLGVDPVQSVQAALDGVEPRPSSTAVEDALRDSLQASRCARSSTAAAEPVNAASFSPDGDLVATGVGERDRCASSGRATHAHAAVALARLGGHDARVRPGDRDARGGRAERAARRRHARRPRRSSTTSRPASWSRRSRRRGVLDVVFADGGREVLAGGAANSLRIWDRRRDSCCARSPGRGPCRRSRSAPTARSRRRCRPATRSSACTRSRRGDSRRDRCTQTRRGDGRRVLARREVPRDDRTAERRTSGTRRRDASCTLLVGPHSRDRRRRLRAGRAGRRRRASTAPARVWDACDGRHGRRRSLGQSQQKVARGRGQPRTVKQLVTVGADRTSPASGRPLGAIPRRSSATRDSVDPRVVQPDGSLLAHRERRRDGAAVETDRADARAARQPRRRRLDRRVQPGREARPERGADGTARIWNAGGGLRADAAAGRRGDGCDVHAGRAQRPHGRTGRDGEALERVDRRAARDVPARSAGARRRLFAPDGDVVTAGDDGVVRAWTAAGRLLWTATHGSPVAALAVAPDGTVATGAADGTVQALARSRRRARCTSLRGPHRRDHVARVRPERRPPRQRQRRRHRAHLERAAPARSSASLAGHTARRHRRSSSAATASWS